MRKLTSHFGLKMSFLLLCGDLRGTTLAYYLYSMTQIEFNVVTKLLNIFKKRELHKRISPQMSNASQLRN